MKAYKDSNDGYYQFDDNAPASWYASLIPCSLQTPLPPTVQQQRDAIQAQINALEQKELYPRLSREIDLQLMEEKAVALGAAQIPTLDAATSLAYAYATNIGYKKLKDFDAQITALRTQMESIV